LVPARDVVERFHRMVRDRDPDALPAWIKDAAGSVLASFGKGIATDYAVVAACRLTLDRHDKKDRLLARAERPLDLVAASADRRSDPELTGFASVNLDEKVSPPCKGALAGGRGPLT
jgi:hypothetical protein